MKMFVTVLLGMVSLMFSTSDIAIAFEAGVRTDTYKISEIQKTVPEARILFVIDNSGSMGNFQQAVADLGNSFFQSLNSHGLHARVGVVSTTLEDAPFIGLKSGDELSTSSLDAANRFSSAVLTLGTNGSGTEKPFDSLDQTAKKFPEFFSMVDPLAVIFVTDEEDQSVMNALQVFNSIKAIQGAGSFLTYGLIASRSLGCFDAAGEKTQAFDDLVKLSKNGAIFSLCQPPVALEMSLTQIVSGIKSSQTTTAFQGSVVLNQADSQTIRVFYNGIELKKGPQGYWTFDEASHRVIFNDLRFATSESDLISITYQIL